MSEVAMKVGQSIAEKALTEAPRGSSQGGESEFAKLLMERMNDQGQMTEKIIHAFGLSPEKEIQSVSAQGLEIPSGKIAPGHEIRTQGKVLELLADVNRDALQMENIIEMATSEKRLSPSQLLAWQAGVAQITLSVELTGKMFEQLNTGTKQLLQTNFA